MPMTPSEIWPMIAGAAIVVFGAGGVVERVRYNKYVSKDVCKVVHVANDGRMERMEVMLRDLHEVFFAAKGGYPKK